MNLPGGVRYSCLMHSFVVPPVSTLHLSRTVGVSSHLNFSTFRFQCLQWNLCFLVFFATDTAFYKSLISLELAKSRIVYAAPVVVRAKTPLISFCIVQLQTPGAARYLVTLSLRSLVQASAVTSSFGALVQTSIMGPHFLVQNVQLGYFLQYRNHCVSLGFFDDSVL